MKHAHRHLLTWIIIGWALCGSVGSSQAGEEGKGALTKQAGDLTVHLALSPMPPTKETAQGNFSMSGTWSIQVRVAHGGKRKLAEFNIEAK